MNNSFGGVGAGKKIRRTCSRDLCHDKSINYLVLWAWQVFLIPPVSCSHSEASISRGPDVTPNHRLNPEISAASGSSRPPHSQSSHPLGPQAENIVSWKETCVKFKVWSQRYRVDSAFRKAVHPTHLQNRAGGGGHGRPEVVQAAGQRVCLPRSWSPVVRRSDAIL